MHITTLLFPILSLLPSLLAAPTLHPELEPRESADPRYTGIRIVSRRSGKCISPLFYRNPGQWAWVGSVDCKDAKTWEIYEDGRVVLSEYPGLALDAGSWPSNNGLLKVWETLPGVYQQTWHVSMLDRRNIQLSLKGYSQCLDEGPDGIQTYECYEGNTNQVFYTEIPM